MQNLRGIDEHVPLSRTSPSSVVPTGAVDRNLPSNLYTAPLQPPLPVSFSPRDQSKLPTTQSNSSQEAKHIYTFFRRSKHGMLVIKVILIKRKRIEKP